MVIAIDAGCLGVTDEQLKAGVYQVAANFIYELSKIDKKNKYILYSLESIAPFFLQGIGPNFVNKVVIPKRGWNKIWIPFHLLKDRPDVFIGLNQALPLKIPSIINYKSISFVYDIGYELHNDAYRQTYNHLRRITMNAVRHSDRVITISDSTKNDLSQYYKVNKRKVFVIYPGISLKNIALNDKKNKKDYFLFLGSLKVSKNIPGIIRAFDLFCKNNPEVDYRLLIFGGNRWLDMDISDSLKNIDRKTRDKVVLSGYIDEEEKWNLYKSATAFVSPSIYEGFGLPFLEAMASGCPVIGSNRGGIPEVVGDAGILVDPYDTEALADAMVRVATDKKLRDEMIKKGLLRAKNFSWETFAQKVYDIINTV